MAINVIETMKISAGQKQVAAFMFNPENDMRWIGGIIEVRDISKLPVTVGSRIHRVATFLGKEIDYILEIIDFEENHFLGMEAVKSPFPMKVSYQVDAENETSCVVNMQLEGSTKGFFMFMDRLSTIMVGETLKGDLRRLKEIMERSDTEKIDVENPPE